jgi:outer membrane protein assembly factor BamB
MNWASALDPATGEPRWEYRGTKEYQNPSPVTDGEHIYLVTYLKTVALLPDGEQAWTFPDGSEICTPICHDGHLYWANEQGLAFCINARTGKSVYQERLGSGRIYASGVLAENRIYYVSRENGTYVVAAKPEFELLAKNAINSDRSVFNATPAMSDGRIYLRSDTHLYCIGAR